MGLQSIFYGTDAAERLATWDSHFLMNLAGNAFNGHCCGAMLLVRHAVLSRLWVLSRQTCPRGVLAQPESESPCDGDDESIEWV